MFIDYSVEIRFNYSDKSFVVLGNSQSVIYQIWVDTDTGLEWLMQMFAEPSEQNYSVVARIVKKLELVEE